MAGTTATVSLRIREALDACSSSIDSGAIVQSDKAVSPVIGLLHSLIESSPSDLVETIPEMEGLETALDEIFIFLASPDSNQMVVDALSLELPKLVTEFALLSDKCRETARRIIEHLVSVSSPREMLSVLCEALASHTNDSREPGCYVHLLIGLSKVFLRIQRRHLEQVKVALPIIIGVLNAVSSEADEEDIDSLKDLFLASINIGHSIQEVCQKLEGQRKDELCAILGLYALQNIALLSRSRQTHIAACSSLLVTEFSRLLPFCGLSYFGLLTGSDFDELCNKIRKEDDDEFIACFTCGINGACLAVIWAHISEDVAKATGEQLVVVFGEIRCERSKRWQAAGMMKHILSSIDYSWVIKSHGLDVLLSILDGIHHNHYNEDFSIFLPNLFASLKAIEKTMMGAPDPSLRKKAFCVFKKVVSDIPSSQRFDILKALIVNSNSPSMIAILIDLVKDEILVGTAQGNSRKEQKRKEISPFWGTNALAIVEMVLRPPKGPPSLPEHSEPVLSALNLFRFIFITESTGETNHTGILSEDSLRKAYSEWLLPLRTLILAIEAENKKNDSEFAERITCALYPVQLVLHRCIELIENLKHSP